MKKTSKSLLIAIKKELKQKDELIDLLEKISRKHPSTHEPIKKSKDRGKNDGKTSPNKNNNRQLSERTLYKERIYEIINENQIGSPHIAIQNQPRLSQEQKMIINWDLEGINLSKEEIKISTYFKNALDTSQNYDVKDRHDPKEYNICNIPIWSEMKKFKNFQLMSFPICSQLANIGYPPDQLHLLNIYDIAFLIKKHNKENHSNLMPCQRSKFLKMFATCYGEEFLRIETALGREEDAKNFLEYIRIQYLNHNENYSDERWAKIQLSASKYNVHHKKNRQFANEIDDYSEINNFSNLTLCYATPYHTILHHPKEIDLNTNLVYLGGLCREFHIIRNPANERLYSQGIYKIPTSGGRNE
jgi:hypothetical protein